MFIRAMLAPTRLKAQKSMVTRHRRTYVNEVGEVMNVVLEHAAVGRLQSQQVLVPCLDGFQLVLSVFSLALQKRWKMRSIRGKKRNGTLNERH